MPLSLELPRAARHESGRIIVTLNSGREISFEVAKNARLARGTPEQLDQIEVSPLGFHWPALDEDLSFRGLLRGQYGQVKGLTRKHPPG